MGRRNSKNKGGTSGAKTTTTKPLSSARRVVKAATPPTKSGIEAEHNLEPNIDSNILVLEEKELKTPVTLTSPSAEKELEEELKDSWRMERTERRAAIQKEHRDQQVKERRMSTHENEPVGEHTEKKVNPDFSVEPQFPEHKRPVEMTSLPLSDRENEPVEKRYKASEEPDDSDEVDRKDSKYFDSWSDWLTPIPAAAIIVAAAAIAIRFMRKN